MVRGGFCLAAKELITKDRLKTMPEWHSHQAAILDTIRNHNRAKTLEPCRYRPCQKTNVAAKTPPDDAPLNQGRVIRNQRVSARVRTC